jgi:DNA-binding MarR family transcriptional regulator
MIENDGSQPTPPQAAPPQPQPTPPSEPPPWLRMPPEEDESPMAQFRRDVLELAREVEAAHRKDGAAREGDSGGGTSSESLTFGPAPVPPESLDVRATTPFLMVRARRALRHRLEAGLRAGGPGPDGSRDGRALVLVEIGRSDGGAAPRKVAQSLGIRGSSLSRVVRRAERDGLVRRRPHRWGGRTSLLELTPEGRRVASRAASAVREADRALLRTLSADERDELRRLLRRAARALAGNRRSA